MIKAREELPGWAKSFLSYPRDNYEFLKSKPESFFDERFSEVGFTFHTAPKKHQKVTLYAAAKAQKLMVLLFLGAGKTYIMLNCVALLKKLSILRANKYPDPKQALILVPNSNLLTVWKEEMKKHRPELSMRLINEASKVKRQRVWESAKEDAIVITYMGFLALMSDLASVIDKDGRRKRKRVINLEKLNAIKGRFGMLVLDEVTAVKNPTSLTFKLLRKFCDSSNIPYRYGLTGTPFGKNLQDLWGQYRIIDGGGALGIKQYTFESVFFDIIPSFWGGVDKKFRNYLMPDLKRCMYHSAMLYNQEECQDLMPLTISEVKIPMSAAMEVYYKTLHEALHQCFSSGGNPFDNSISLWIQSREVVSNFVMFRDEKGNKAIQAIPGEGKLEATLQIIDSVPEGHKVVVFTEFVYSNRRILKALQKAGIGAAAIEGETKNREAQIHKFEVDPNCKVLVLMSKLGAMGLNLQQANYLIAYELPIRYITYIQAIGRIRRSGQKYPVFMFVPLIENSVDEAIYQSLKSGESVRKYLLQHPDKFPPFHGHIQ